MNKRKVGRGLAVGVALFLGATALAAQEAAGPAPEQVAMDTLWVLFAAALVFFMQAGFALLEAGLQAAKNVVNILMKNLMDFTIASVAFWARSCVGGGAAHRDRHGHHRPSLQPSVGVGCRSGSGAPDPLRPGLRTGSDRRPGRAAGQQHRGYRRRPQAGFPVSGVVPRGRGCEARRGAHLRGLNRQASFGSPNLPAISMALS